MLQLTGKLSVAGVLFVGLLGGLAIWGGYESVTAAVTTNAFCVSCHEMRGMAEDYEKSVHFTNAAGVRAQCADCHVPRPVVARVIHMIGAAGEVVGHIAGVIDTPAKLDARRLDMAKSVWAEMAADNSRSCRNCHSFEAMDFARQRPRSAAAMHAPMQPGTSCIDCHKGIAHRLAVVAAKPAAAPRPPAAAAPLPTPPSAAASAASAPSGSAPSGSAPSGSAPSAVAPSAVAPSAVTPSAVAMSTLPEAASPIMGMPGTKAFVGEATVTLAATPGGPSFATLYVSAPVILTATGSGASHVMAALWMKGSAALPGALFAAPDGVEVGRLDDPDVARAGESRGGWVAVEISGYVAAAAIVESLGPAWQAAETTYEFTCGGCHQLHPAEKYTPAQWANEMTSMAKSAHLGADDAMVLLKWLQTNSFEHRSGK